MKLATLCLSSCSGCHGALLDLGQQFADVLKTVELAFSPVLADVKECPECDVALVEGAVRSEKDVRELKHLRERSKLLVALGTCASFGGICGLGNVHAAKTLLDTAYQIKKPGVPGMIPRLVPIDEFVAVDYFLPGCPPTEKLLTDFLTALIEGQEPKANDLPVCAECERRVNGAFSRELKLINDAIPEEKTCLLQQGYVCLGSVTRAGCGALCPHVGHPCDGCRGPSHKVLLHPSHGIYIDLVRRRSHYLGISEAEAKRELDAFIGPNLYRFTMGSSLLRRRNMDKVSAFIHRVNVDTEGIPGGK